MLLGVGSWIFNGEGRGGKGEDECGVEMMENKVVREDIFVVMGLR